MSLKLKGRRIYYLVNPSYPGRKREVTGRISGKPIYLEVVTDTGDVTKVEENNLHFDLKKRGKGK